MNLPDAVEAVRFRAADLFAYADQEDRRRLARLCKRVCLEQQHYDLAAIFRDIEHERRDIGITFRAED